MWAYIIRRILLTIPTVLGILLLTFVLFGLVGDPARAYAGKNPTPAVVKAIRAKMGLDKPRWLNCGPKVEEIRRADGTLTIVTDTNHALSEGDSALLSGMQPAEFNGQYRVLEVRSSTVLIVLPAGAPAPVPMPGDGVSDGPSTVPASAPAAQPPPSTVSAEPRANLPATEPTTQPATAPASDAPTASEGEAAGGELIKVTAGRLHRVGFGARFSELFNTQFFDLLLFRFPKSMRYGESIWSLILRKGPVSLTIQGPAFLITTALQLVIALYVAASRGKKLDVGMTFFTVLVLSVPTISIYLLFQWVLAAKVPIFPLAGWTSGLYALQFAALPILATVFVSVGGGARFYRTVALDEISADYVRTARAKGAAQARVLLTHVLRNVMIPVITNTVTALPFLVFGALILEQIFQIPGLGGLLVQGIFEEDRPVVMSVTYVTAVVYCLALLVNDILYTVVDPRVSLK